MSEVAPKKIRGAIVSGYQFSVTVGLLLAACVSQGTHARDDSGSYRIPIAIQFLWGIILGGGIFFLPESPRYYVMKDRREDAARSLSRLRSQPTESAFVQEELIELIANREYELRIIQPGWLPCFKGGWAPSSNLRRSILGILLQMMQQWTGYAKLNSNLI
jgi:MFS family permease